MAEEKDLCSVQKTYLTDDNGNKIVFYECDPNKNNMCSKTMCRYSENGSETDTSVGFCAKTTIKEFRKDGGKAWYAVMKQNEIGEPYWGREYIDE